MRSPVFLFLAPAAAMGILGLPNSAQANYVGYIGRASPYISEIPPYSPTIPDFGPTTLFTKNFNVADAHGFDFSSAQGFIGSRGDSGSYSLRMNAGNGSLGATATLTGAASDSASQENFASAVVELDDSKIFHVTAKPTFSLTVHSHLNLNGFLSSAGTSSGGGSVFLFLLPTGLSIDAPQLDYDVSNVYAYSRTYPGLISERFPNERNDPKTIAHAAPGIIPVTEHVTPEVPHAFSIEMGLGLEADAIKYGDAASTDCPCQPGTSEASGTFADTLSWGGIDSVIDDSTGLPITDWTVTSASGFDYSKPGFEPTAPVPEPPSAALLLAGLTMFGVFGAPLRRRAKVAAV